MDDLSFRAEFHRALDPIAPPAPWLAVAVREGFRRRGRRAMPWPGGLTSLPRPSWLLPAVAALVVILLVLGLLVGSHILRLNPTIPVRPPQHGMAGPPGCPSWGTNSGGGQAARSDRMFSLTTGWVDGALRTSDGGAHWGRVVPDDMLADAPKGTDVKAYPPAYVDYFVDSNHGWLAYSLPSKTSCFDHVTVFSTSDAGRTWRRSTPVSAAIQADTSLQLQLDFLDAKHGWMTMLAYGRIAPDSFLYTTADGGLTWQLQSQLPNMASGCGLHFISLTVGFSGGCPNTSSPTASLTFTRDGGRTWSQVRLPEPAGNQFTVTAPTFFDQMHGIVQVIAQSTQGNTISSSDYVAITNDGGQTWSAQPSYSIPGYAQAFFFVDESRYYAVVTDGKGDTATLYRTIDGGHSWGAMSSLPPLMYGPQIMFIDQQRGFLEEPPEQIGKAPRTFLSTTDGGRTWKDVHPQVS